MQLYGSNHFAPNSQTTIYPLLCNYTSSTLPSIAITLPQPSNHFTITFYQPFYRRAFVITLQSLCYHLASIWQSHKAHKTTALTFHFLSGVEETFKIQVGRFFFVFRLSRGFDSDAGCWRDVFTHEEAEEDEEEGTVGQNCKTRSF